MLHHTGVSTRTKITTEKKRRRPGTHHRCMRYGCYLPVLAGFAHFLARPNRRVESIEVLRLAVTEGAHFHLLHSASLSPWLCCSVHHHIKSKTIYFSYLRKPKAWHARCCVALYAYNSDHPSRDLFPNNDGKPLVGPRGSQRVPPSRFRTLQSLIPTSDAAAGPRGCPSSPGPKTPPWLPSQHAPSRASSKRRPPDHPHQEGADNENRYPSLCESDSKTPFNSQTH